MAAFGIGVQLRKERLAQGRTLDDISRATKIAQRFLEAIEADDFDSLPGLVFARNFVRQYALAVKLDSAPLLAELPKQDESSIKLPDPPPRTRSAYNRDRRVHSILSSVAWLLIAGGAGTAAYLHFNRSAAKTIASSTTPVVNAPPVQESAPVPQSPAQPPESPAEAQAPGATSHAPVQVVLTAHQPAWVQVSVDGKTSFTGTLQPDEIKEVSAAEQVRISTGNAGALTISLNGKTLEAFGTTGQIREIKLTAEGQVLLSKAPPPPPDPL